MKQEDALNLLQPYVDGELDAATSLELERYVMGDAIARAQLARLRALSSALRAEADYHVAPGSLRTGILSRTRGAAAPGSQRSTRFASAQWLRSIGIGVAAATVAGIATMTLLRPTLQDLTEHDIFAAHARATVSDRLLDVASSDQHTVKPWLSARLGFSPPVLDLSGSGFELVGGRIDVVDGQRVAVLVYRRRQHMPGVIGLLFHEFAVVVGLAIVVSAFVSLTLVPMLASRMLTDEAHKKPPGALVRSFERAFNASLGWYTRTLDLALRHQTTVLAIALLTFIATAVLFYFIPKGFFPEEDIGQITVSTEAAEDTSFPEMVRLQEQAAAVFRADPNVNNVSSFNGGSGAQNTGRMFVSLKPRGERQPMKQVVEGLRRKLRDVAGINVFMKTETTAQPRRDNTVLIEADVPMCAYLWQWRLQISDERAIREVHTIWIDAVKAGDLVRLLTLMADGGAHTLSPAAS